MLITKRSIFRMSLALTAGALISAPLSIPSGWAADCSKAGDSKSPICVSATAKAGPGGSMQTVDQGGAQAQKKAVQSNSDSRTVTNGAASREKRNWVGQTSIICKKGSVTLHFAAGSAQCPDGFHKS